MAAADLTKLHLCSIFMDMCADQAIGKITVSALVKRAGVARATFYNNFRDINDLINFIPIYSITKNNLPVFDPQNVRKALEFAIDHRAFFSQLSRHVGQNNFRDTFITWSRQLCYRNFIDGTLSESERRYRRLRIDHVCAGHVELLFEWYQEGMVEGVDLMVKAMYDSTPRFMREGLDSMPSSFADVARDLP